MKKLILLFTTLLMFGCDGMFDEGSTNMDALFTNGFNMKLEQVYVISVNSINTTCITPTLRHNLRHTYNLPI